MDRIEFLKKVAAGGSLLLIAPGLFNSCSKNGDITNPGIGNGGDALPLEIDLTSSAFSDLGTVGGYAYSGNIIIFRTGENTYMALSKICTHQSCTVTYNYNSDNITCPCHGSRYTTSGVVINGPAPLNLKKYNVTKNGNTLTIS